MTIKNILITTVIVALAGVALFAISQPRTIIERVEDRVGALTGPDIPYTYLTVGGVRHEFRSRDFTTTASTTFCTLETPTGTSTLLAYTARGSRATSDGATTFDFGVGSTAYATSSTLGTIAAAQTWGSGAQFDFATSSNALIIPPNKFLVIKLATSSLSANFSATGQCGAVFQVL